MKTAIKFTSMFIRRLFLSTTSPPRGHKRGASSTPSVKTRRGLRRFSPPAGYWLDRLAQPAGVVGRAAALGEAQDLEHPHCAIERDRHHVAGADGAARRVDTDAVDPHVPRGRERRRRRTRAHHARMPQPFVDALPIGS